MADAKDDTKTKPKTKPKEGTVTHPVYGGVYLIDQPHQTEVVTVWSIKYNSVTGRPSAEFDDLPAITPRSVGSDYEYLGLYNSAAARKRLATLQEAADNKANRRRSQPFMDLR